jgi:ABC-2 type transport system permease protein
MTITTARPVVATGRSSLLRAELARLRFRRLVVATIAIALLLVVALGLVNFFTHSKDLAAARTQAASMAATQQKQMLESYRDCKLGKFGQDQNQCGPDPSNEQLTTDQFMIDPRFFADIGLPEVALATSALTVLAATLLGATAVGADWSSRTVITLLTWQPRRSRFLATRLVAVGMVTAAVAILAQAMTFGLGWLTVTLRGTWEASPHDPAVPPPTLWPDLLWAQGRGVLLAVLAAVGAAAVTSLLRHTGGLLGLAFAWSAVIESVLRVFLVDKAWNRWLITEQVMSFLTIGGKTFTENLTGNNQPDSTFTPPMHLVTNLDALTYLTILIATCVALATLVLRRRDL